MKQNSSIVHFIYYIFQSPNFLRTLSRFFLANLFSIIGDYEIELDKFPHNIFLQDFQDIALHPLMHSDNHD